MKLLLTTSFKTCTFSNMPPESNDNYTVFRDCFSTALLQRVAQSPAKQPKRRTPRRRKNEKAAHDGEYKPSGNDADDLSDFIEV